MTDFLPDVAAKGPPRRPNDKRQALDPAVPRRGLCHRTPAPRETCGRMPSRSPHGSCWRRRHVPLRPRGLAHTADDGAAKKETEDPLQVPRGGVSQGAEARKATRRTMGRARCHLRPVLVTLRTRTLRHAYGTSASRSGLWGGELGTQGCQGGWRGRLTILNLSHVHVLFRKRERASEREQLLPPWSLHRPPRQNTPHPTAANPALQTTPPASSWTGSRCHNRAPGPWHAVGPQEVALETIKETKALSPASPANTFPPHHKYTNTQD